MDTRRSKAGKNGKKQETPASPPSENVSEALAQINNMIVEEFKALNAQFTKLEYKLENVCCSVEKQGLRKVTQENRDRYRIQLDARKLLSAQPKVEKRIVDRSLSAHLKFPIDYPYSPPTFRFLTKMWHPNIYENGDVCISILHPPVDDPQSGELPSERWNPTQNVRTILLSVISLLNEPNTFSPANVDASVMFRKWRDSKGKDKEYAEIIRYSWNRCWRTSSCSSQMNTSLTRGEQHPLRIPFGTRRGKTRLPSSRWHNQEPADCKPLPRSSQKKASRPGAPHAGLLRQPPWHMGLLQSGPRAGIPSDPGASRQRGKQVLSTKAEAEKDGVKVPTTLAEYCIKTKVPSNDNNSDLLYDDLYDDDLDEEEEEEEDADCYDDEDSGNEES
ncbi:ubiquitin-conjugating enzyme E2 R2 isoform X2 [Narcine bancroftii]